MNIALGLLLALLALPFLELAAFITVVLSFGLIAAVAAQALCSFAGLMILRHAGGAHVARLRTAFGNAGFTSLRADGTGSLTLLAGILLLVPGFITDAAGLVLLLVAALRRQPASASNDGIIDLPPQQWHQVEEPKLERHDRTRP